MLISRRLKPSLFLFLFLFHGTSLSIYTSVSRERCAATRHAATRGMRLCLVLFLGEGGGGFLSRPITVLDFDVIASLHEWDFFGGARQVAFF